MASRFLCGLAVGLVVVGPCLGADTLDRREGPDETTVVQAPFRGPAVHEGGAWGLVITPDGRSLISSGADHDIKIWSLENGRLVTTLSGLPKAVYEMDASGQLARVDTGGHSATVPHLAITPDGRTLVSGSSDSRVKLWSLPEGRLRTTLTAHEHLIVGVAISHDGKILATAEDERSTVALWSLPDGRRFGEIENDACVYSLAFAPDGTLAVGDCHQGVVHLWSAQDRRLIRTLGPYRSRVQRLRFNADGSRLAILLRDEKPRLWSRETGEAQELDFPGAGTLGDIAFLPDGTTLVGGGTSAAYNREGTYRPGRVSIWSGTQSRLMAVLESLQNSQRSGPVAVSPDGKVVAAGGYDGAIVVWHLDPPGFAFALAEATAQPQ